MAGLPGVAAAQTTPVITWLTPAPSVYGTALGPGRLNATAKIPGTFVYTPASGAVLPVGSNTLSVTFTPNDTTDYTTATKTVTLVVSPRTPVISWNTPAAINYGTALSATQLRAATTPAGTFVYSPVAGTVLAPGNQTLSVTFTPNDTVDYTSATGTVTLMVNQQTPVITWRTPAPSIYGTPLGPGRLNASASVPGTLVYTPVSGTVLPAGSQTLSVTFTPDDSTDYAPATKSVTLVVDPRTPGITWATPAAMNYGTALSHNQLYASASVAGTFAYSPAAGTVLPAGSQTLSVTFTPNDSADYTTATASVTVMVNQKTPDITWPTPEPSLYNTPLGPGRLNASSTVPGTFAYTPGSGAVLPAGSQTLSVTFTPTDATDYTSATKSVTLVVSPRTPVIAWTSPASITYGTALGDAQLNATTTVLGTLDYSPAAGAVLDAGTQTLSVTFTPNDNVDFNTSMTSVSLIVGPATPAITWNTPSAITYGTALSATQLDAASTVAGTFDYSPALGAVLNAGSQTLSVTFTPTDGIDYTTATASVTLTVNNSSPFVAHTIQITDDADDGYYNNDDGSGWDSDPQAGGAIRVGNVIGITDAWIPGYRFPATGINSGDAIQSAYLELNSSDDYATSVTCGSAPCTNSSTSFRVYGVAQDDGPAFSGEAGNTPMDVPYTAAYSDYTTTGPGDVHGSCQGNNNGQNTCTHIVDVTSIVQEITSRPGWTNASAMRFVLPTTDSTPYVYAGFEDSSANSAKAATLVVNPPTPTIMASGAWGTSSQETYPTSYGTGPFVTQGASTLLLFLGDYYNFYGDDIPQPSVTDSCGNTWNILAGPTNWAGIIYYMRSTVYYVQSPAACPGGDTITVTAAIEEPIFLHFLAVAGSDSTVTPVVSDINSPSPGTYTTTATTDPITLANGGLLVSWIFGDSDATHTFTPQSGFIPDVNSTPTYLMEASENVSVGGAYQNTFTIGPTSDGWQAIIIGLSASPD
ncbi:MAG TPA: hypothetical protein VHX60_00880 [Acidobacteriaceae bacterium]|jgi:hypothetical protein|nr:hypothetical protein [Acidobacteriaceae bacterium]